MAREMRRVAPDWEHPLDPTDVTGFKRIKAENMPQWTEGEATHYQMYEVTSEGTPLSPPMESPEELAQWLVENKASAFGGRPASYEAWLKVCKGEPSISAFINEDGKVTSGVQGAYDHDRLKQSIKEDDRNSDQDQSKDRDR